MVLLHLVLHLTVRLPEQLFTIGLVILMWVLEQVELGNIPSFAATNPGTATVDVTATDDQGCTGSPMQFTVTINDLPSVSTNLSSPEICLGSGIEITASGAQDYVWSPSAGLSSTTGATVTADPTTTTTYTVTGTDINGCTNSTLVTVTVNPPPTITISPASVTICEGASTTLTASGADTYAWSPAAGLSATTGSTVTASPSNTTTYTVTGTDSNGCENTQTVTVTVNTPPTLTSSLTPTGICSGSVFNYEPTSATSNHLQLVATRNTWRLNISFRNWINQ